MVSQVRWEYLEEFSSRVGRKLTADDARDDGLKDVALNYLWELEPDPGTFPFIASVKEQLETRGFLTPAQVAGVLNVMVNSLDRPEDGLEYGDYRDYRDYRDYDEGYRS